MDIIASNQWKGKQEGWEFLPWDAPVWPFPWVLNAELTGGWAGFGVVYETLPEIWLAFAFAVLWFGARQISKTFIFPPLARALGIKKHAKISKFSYNMWLLAFYSFSTLFGYFYALQGEKYFVFPVDAASGEAMFNFHPATIQPKTHLYCMYQLGFYIAELYAIFVEARRSDFIEYVIHHIVTIWLIGLSHVAREQRGGANVIFIHDVPDVFLCLAKMFVYTKSERLSTITFTVFTATFAYLRLYCLPIVLRVMFYQAPQYHPATTSFWMLAYLGCLLQALQVFWFVMIIKLIVKLAVNGKAGDPRSDSDDDESKAKKSSSETRKTTSKR